MISRSESSIDLEELRAPEDDEFHIHAESGEGATRVLKSGDTFAVFDRHGDVGVAAQGSKP